MRIRVNRGTSVLRSARPEASLKSVVKPAPAPGCCTRKYIPDPARNFPLRLSVGPAPVAGARGNVTGIAFEQVHGEGVAYAARNDQVLYVSSGGAVTPGRSDTQLASPQRETSVATGVLFACCITLVTPVALVLSRPRV